MRRRWWVAAALVPLAAAAWWARTALATGNGDWVDVRRGDLVIGTEVEGTLQAIDSGTLGPPQLSEVWDFKISHMTPEGDQVEQGAVVLGFDTSQLQQKLQERMAEAEQAAKEIEKTRRELELNHKQDVLRLAEARASLRKAELKVDVPSELEQGNKLQRARLDLELARREIAYLETRIRSAGEAADASLAALENQRQRAEAEVTSIQEGIQAMSVKAPRAGTVIYVTNWRDEKKKVGDSCWRGESVIELPDLERMMAKGEVDEADAGRIAEGQRVKFELDAHPDAEFHGRIESIWRTVQRKSWRTPLKVVRMDIALDETDTRRMRPGMRFRGEIEIERIEDAVLIPTEAVITTSDGPVAYRRGWLGSERVALELGRRNDTDVEVLAGLAPGDRVARSAPGGDDAGSEAGSGGLP